MLRSVRVTNDKNESLEMVLADPESSEFIVESIDGLGPEKTNINSTENQIYDGASFDSAVTGVKNIVLHLIFWPTDWNVERVRHKSYDFFPTKGNIKLEFFSDDRSVYIDGYVESNEPRIFDSSEGCDISVLCMEPYFKSNTQTDLFIKGLNPEFQFPFSNNSLTEKLLIMGNLKYAYSQLLYYNGEVETGVELIVEFSDDISSVISLKNITYDQTIDIDMYKIKNKHNITIADGDYLIVDTTQGNKTLKLFKQSTQQEYDADIGLNITTVEWITLSKGYNNISVSYNVKIKSFEIRNRLLYGGV